MFDLEGKKALITGASGGIGKEIAKVLIEHNAEVCISGRNHEELNALKKSLGKKCHVVTCDLSKKDEIIELIKKADEFMGYIDILVNNAGITKDNIFLRMSENEWEDVLNVNLNSTFNILKLITKGMVKRKYGRIINISSVSGLMGNPGQVNYASSKSGLNGFTKSLAKEVGSRNITVNSVAPGFIDTDMTSFLDSQARLDVIKNIPLGRFGHVDDISKVVMFLASDNASYITGQIISVDGGLLMY